MKQKVHVRKIPLTDDQKAWLLFWSIVPAWAVCAALATLAGF
jgi:hypothetical protein